MNIYIEAADMIYDTKNESIVEFMKEHDIYKDAVKEVNYDNPEYGYYTTSFSYTLNGMTTRNINNKDDYIKLVNNEALEKLNKNLDRIHKKFKGKDYFITAKPNLVEGFEITVDHNVTPTNYYYIYTCKISFNVLERKDFEVVGMYKNLEEKEVDKNE